MSDGNPASKEKTGKQEAGGLVHRTRASAQDAFADQVESATCPPSNSEMDSGLICENR
jgi:hypothetical protein